MYLYHQCGLEGKISWNCIITAKFMWNQNSKTASQDYWHMCFIRLPRFWAPLISNKCTKCVKRANTPFSHSPVKFFAKFSDNVKCTRTLDFYIVFIKFKLIVEKMDEKKMVLAIHVKNAIKMLWKKRRRSGF